MHNQFQIPRPQQPLSAQAAQNQSQKQNQDKDAALQDPNLMMAMAMVKSISSFMDEPSKSEDKKLQESKEKKAADVDMKNQDEGSKGKGFSNPFAKSSEAIELNPIDELSQVITSKKLLTRQQVQALDQLLFKVNENFLSFQTSNSSAHINLVKSTLELISTALTYMSDAKSFVDNQQSSQNQNLSSSDQLQQQVESLSVSSNSNQQFQEPPCPYLYNKTLTVILRILEILSSQQSLDKAYFSYLQEVQSSLIGTSSLQHYNPFLKTFVKQLYEQQSAEAQNKIQSSFLGYGQPSQEGKDQIALPTNQANQMLQSNQEDSDESNLLMKALDFVPADHKLIESQINQQFQSKLLQIFQSSQKIQENKEDEKMENDEPKFIDKVKALIDELKIKDLVQQSINNFCNLVTNLEGGSYEFIIMTDPLLLAELQDLAQRNEHLLFNSSINKLYTKDFASILISTTKKILDLDQESKSEMQIDSLTHNKPGESSLFNLKGFSENQQQVLKQGMILAKILSICTHLKSKDIDLGLSNFFSISGKFKFLINTVKKDQKLAKEIKPAMMSTINSILSLVAMRFGKVQQSQQQIQQIESEVLSILNLIRAHKNLQQIKQSPTFYSKDSVKSFGQTQNTSFQPISSFSQSTKAEAIPLTKSISAANPFTQSKPLSQPKEAFSSGFQLGQTSSSQSQASIRTRSQMRREQQRKSQGPEDKNDSTLQNPFIKGPANQAIEQATEEKKNENPLINAKTSGAAQKQKKQVFSSRLTTQVIQDAFYVDDLNLTKSLLSALAIKSNSYIETSVKYSQGQTLYISYKLLKGLFQFSMSQSSVTSRLAYEILSTFTKSSHKLTIGQSLADAQKILTKQLDYILQSNISTSFLIRLLILQRDTDQLKLILKELIQKQDLWNLKKTTVKKTQEMFSTSQNLRRYILLSSSLIMLDPNDFKQIQNELILSDLIPQITSQRNQTSSTAHFYQNFHFLFLLVNQQKVLVESFSPIVFKYLTSQLSDEENQPQVDKFSEEIQLLLKAIGQKQADNSSSCLDKIAVQTLSDNLGLNQILEMIHSNYLIHLKGEQTQQERVMSLLSAINGIYGSENLSTDELLQRIKNGERSTLLYAQLELIYRESTENLKTIIEAHLNDEGSQSLIMEQLELIKLLSTILQEQYQEFCREFYSHPEDQADFSIAYLRIIYQFIQNPFSPKVGSILQTAIKSNAVSSGKAFANDINDHFKFAKYIYSTMKQEQNECIFAHCYSQPSIDQQKLISIQMLLRSLWKNMNTIMNTLGQDDQSIKIDIAKTLLFLQNTNPVISYNEDTYLQDSQLIDKILNLVHPNEKYNTQSYQKIKQLCRGLSLISQSSAFIKTSFRSGPLSPQQIECIKTLHALCQEAGQFVTKSYLINAIPDSNQQQSQSSLFQFLQTKMSETYQYLFFTQAEADNFGDLNLIELAWKQTLILISLSSELSILKQQQGGNSGEEVKIDETKGGMLLTFPTGKDSNSEKPKGKDSASKPFKKSGQRNSANEAQYKQNKNQSTSGNQSSQDQVMKEDTTIHITKQKVYLDPLAQKLLTFITDMIQHFKDSKNLSVVAAIKEIILRYQQEENIVSSLINLESLQLLKSFITILFTLAGDQNNQSQIDEFKIISLLRDKFNQLLASAVRTQENRDEEFLVGIIDLALIIFDDNLQLIKFIQRNILNLSVLKQSPTKLLILELLCQLGSSKYSKEIASSQDGEKIKLKYNISQVQEARKKQQEAKASKKSQQNQLKAKQLQENDEALKSIDNQVGSLTSSKQKKVEEIAQVDGFKQFEVNKEDAQDAQKYMEKIGNVCTYVQTQKKFADQHWYFCYTCNLTGSSGCCAVCAHRCHKGHQVAYSRKSNFFCDCGDSGRCQSMKQQENESKANNAANQSRRPFSRQSKRQERKERIGGREIEQVIEAPGGFKLDQSNRYQNLESMLYSSILSRERGSIAQNPQYHEDPFRPFRDKVQNRENESNMLFGAYGRGPSGLPHHSFAYEFNDEFEDDFHQSQIFKHILERENNQLDIQAPSFFNNAQQPELRQVDERGSQSSDEDVYDDEDEDLNSIAIKKDQDRLRGLRSMSKIMSLISKHQANDPNLGQGLSLSSEPFIPKIKRQADKLNISGLEDSQAVEGQKFRFSNAQRKNSGSSVSQMSMINPLEDPLSESGQMTPFNLTDQFNIGGDPFQAALSQIANTQADVEMEDADVSNALKDIRDILKSEQSHFDEIYNDLMINIDSLIAQNQHQARLRETQIDGDEVMSSASSISNFNRGLAQKKQSIKLTQDLTSLKRSIKDSFDIKFPEQVKNALKKNLNMIQLAANSKEGLIALCQNDKDIVFYASSQFCEESYTSNLNDRFQFEIKEGSQVNFLEVYNKLNFTPTLLKFNPSYQNFLAVAGINKLDVLTFNHQGKVQSKLSVDLMLEIISDELQIVDVAWLPDSKTMIAVATRDFVKIYDLALDNISPTHTISIFTGFIKDFTFGAPEDRDSINAVTPIFVSTNQGQIFYHQIVYNKNSLANAKQQDSNSSSASHQNDVLMKDANENSQIMMTQILDLSDFELVEQPCESIYYAPRANLLIMSFRDGVTMAGKVDAHLKFTGFNLDLIGDSCQGASQLKTCYKQNGQVITSMNESRLIKTFHKKDGKNVPVIKSYITAVARKIDNLSQGLPIILEISEESVVATVIKSSPGTSSIPCAYGLICSQNSSKVVGHQLRIIVFNSQERNSATYAFQPFTQLSQSINLQETSESQSVGKPIQQSQLIKRSDLPKTVKLTINFFEKMKNVYNEPHLKPKLSITGDILNTFKTSKATFDALSKGNQQPVFVEASKKSIKMILQLDSKSEHIITGFRVRVEQNPKSSHGIQLRIFNRIVNLKSQFQAVWNEVPFCDAEAMFGSFNTIDCEFFTSSNSEAPIKIYGVEIFAQSKKDFNFKGKLKRLESEQQPAAQQPSLGQKVVQNSADSSIENQLLQTNHVPLLGWKEISNKFNQLGKEDKIMIHRLDIITNYIEYNPEISHQGFESLENKLKSLLKFAVLENGSNSDQSQGKYKLAAIKRCLKKLLSIRYQSSHKLVYQNIKDDIILDQAAYLFGTQTNKQTTTEFSTIRKCLQNLSKILNKRNYLIFMLVQKHPVIIQNLIESYLKSGFSIDKFTTSDVSDLLSLLFTHYISTIDQLRQDFSQSGKPLAEIIIDLNQIQALDILSPSLDLLLHCNNEQIQKCTVSMLLKQIEQYQLTQSRIIHLNMLPTMKIPKKNEDMKSSLIDTTTPGLNKEEDIENKQFIVIDPSPQIIRYLFNSITNLRDQSELEYSLVFKMIKLYEQNCFLMYPNQIETQNRFLKLVTTQIGDFIIQTMREASEKLYSNIYDSKNSHKAQYLYLSLVLVNLLMQEINDKSDSNQTSNSQNKAQDQKSKIKIKNSRIQLSSISRNLVLQSISSNVQNSEILAYGVMSILRDLENGFKQGKCSLVHVTEDGIPSEVKDRGAQILGGQVNLLRPLLQLSSWKWHPLFTNTESIFEVLDRKIPAQTLILIQSVVSQTTDLDYKIFLELCQSIKSISLKNPCKTFLVQLGDLALQKLSQRNSQSSDANQSIKLEPALNEFLEVFEPIYFKFLAREQQLSYNLSFKLHKALQIFVAKILVDVSQWSQLFLSLDSSNQSQMNGSQLLHYLINASYQLDEYSSSSCLFISATALLSYEESEGEKVRVKLRNILGASSPDLNGLLEIKHKSEQRRKDIPQKLDIRRIIKTQLLGKNQARIRQITAYLLKGIYEQGNQAKEELVSIMLAELQFVRSKGVNSLEFIILLQYIINREIEQKHFSKETMEQIVKHVYSEIVINNTSISAHPNLAIYSTLQKLTNVFSQNGEEDISYREEISLQKAINQSQQKYKKITNPYILESEVCSKCYSLKGLPNQNLRVNDLKTESKFTDSTHIYRLNQTYQIRQFSMAIHEIKGHKVLRQLSFYVNNKQGIDLADMRNNWSHWRKVQTIDVKVGQRVVTLDFPLPVNATNILIEMTSINISKPFTGKEKNAPEEVQNNVENGILTATGLDTVLQTLPIEVKNKIGFTSVANQKDQNELLSSVFQQDQIFNCPRCQKVIQGQNKVCNQCGEHAMQCTYCRNINYDKPDAFLCNECGFSRYAKFEFSIIAKIGYAAERIENDDQKNLAQQQIENYLKDAQANYTKLMGQRDRIDKVFKGANNGGDQATYSDAVELYGEVCATFYQHMMKQLNMIKILKQEIQIYQNGNLVEEELQSEDFTELQSMNINSKSNNLSCFSCIQENQRGYLQLLRQTANNLKDQYRQNGFINLLYRENLNSHKASLQTPAKYAICEIADIDESIVNDLIQSIKQDLSQKSAIIPSYMLSQNISSQSQMMIALLSHHQQLKDSNRQNLYLQVKAGFEEILMLSIKDGKSNAAIADEVAAQFLQVLKPQSNLKQEDLKEKLQEFSQILKKKGIDNLLIQSLIMTSSSSVRDIAKEIISNVIVNLSEIRAELLETLMGVIGEITPFQNECSQFFDVLALLLKDKITVELCQKHPAYLNAFESLFIQIEKELSSLVDQEGEKKSIGVDGLMPQISTGQVLSRLVTLIANMIKGSTYLTNRIQQNVNLVIKSYLKIRKLDLTRNKLIQDSEVELEKIFKQLHSQKEEDKESFILECFRIIESGSCDLTEIRFLIEEISKVINPIKPIPDYQLAFNRPQTQEQFFRGNLQKQIFQSSALGKTMGDVRKKICKESEVEEPEMVELLVTGKIISTDLPIIQVYEQVFWPALCKQRDPELYDIPPIEDAPRSSLQPMAVTYRIIGLDGESTEDRVENLVDENEAESNPQVIEKKYGVTLCLLKQFPSSKISGKMINGISVLLDVCQSMESMQKNRYLAEWLFKLIQSVIKMRPNKQAILQQSNVIQLFSKRLFESIGVLGQVEGSNGLSLFDFILNILEQLVSELTLMQESNSFKQINEDTAQSSRMEIDTSESNNAESTNHIQIFMDIMNNSCAEMMENGVSIERTSQKIRSVSKILPFLIAENDNLAINKIVEYFNQSLENLKRLDRKDLKLKFSEKLNIQFNIERSIEIIESCPSQKNFLKQAFTIYNDQQMIRNILSDLQNNLLANYQSEDDLLPNKLTIQYLLKFIHGLFKNHPLSQSILNEEGCKILEILYNLTQAKHAKEKIFIILAQDIVQTLTNKNLQADEQVFKNLSNLLNNQQDEKKKLAQRKREEIMRQMQNKKNANKFIKQVENVSIQEMEEQGPKCIVCSEGYTKKPTEILGIYVFSKKAKITEIQQVGQGAGHTQFVNSTGYITVTHSNYIHFICHENARRADQSLKQPKKEWEGAVIRNDHTKCNNLYPLRGGNLPEDAYYQMVEKYFVIQQKTIGSCDSDKTKVCLHDMKVLMKRLSYEESFSRDSLGGGPEHNMHLLPFMIQMIHYILKMTKSHNQASSHSLDLQSGKFDYKACFRLEKVLIDFLEQANNKQSSNDFLNRLEEEKKMEEEYEEEEKFESSENDGSANIEDESEEEKSVAELSQANQLKLDQIAYMLTLALVFSQSSVWEIHHKKKFLSLILSIVSSMKDDKGVTQIIKFTGQQTDYASGQKILSISKQSEGADIQMAEPGEQPRRRRLSSDNKIEVVQRSLLRLRPLLIHLRLIDLIKKRWDVSKLNLGQSLDQLVSQDKYLEKLNQDLLSKSNLQEIISECDEVFKNYKERMIKFSSVEEFLEELGLREQIVLEFGGVEQYVLSHF